MADQDTAKTPNPVRVLAKTMWQTDNKETFETSEARDAAYAAVKQEYRKKAGSIAKLMDKKGVTLVVAEGIPA